MIPGSRERTVALTTIVHVGILKVTPRLGSTPRPRKRQALTAHRQPPPPRGLPRGSRLADPLPTDSQERALEHSGTAAVQADATVLQLCTSLRIPQSAICSHNHSWDTFQIPVLFVCVVVRAIMCIPNSLTTNFIFIVFVFHC